MRDDPYRIATVTPADADLTYVTAAVMIGGAGTLIVTDCSGTVTTLTGLAVGVWHPINVKRIALLSGATNIAAMY